MPTSIGKAYVQIVPSAEGIRDAVSDILNDQLPGAGEQSGGSLAQGLASGLKKGGALIATGLAAATAGVVAFGKSSVDAGMGFDSAMSQIAATLGWTTEEINSNAERNGVMVGDTFDALRAKAAEMGSSTVYSAQEAAEGLNILAMSGYDAEQSMSMIEDVLHLAAAGSMDMASAAGYVSGAMKGFNDETKDSGYYADLMAKGATLANTSVAELGEAMSSGAAGAAAYGQSADSMTIALLRLAEQGEVGAAAGTALSAAMKNLYTPTDQGAKALTQLGVAAYNSDGSARDFNDVVNDLSSALSGMSAEEANAYKQTIFGIQGLDAFNKMTVTGVEKQTEWAAALAGASDGMGEAAKQYETMTDNLQGDLSGWNSSLEGFKIAVSDELTPTIREFVQFATSGMSEVTEAFKTGGIDAAVDTLGFILADGLQMLMDILPEVLQAGMDLLAALLEGIILNLPTISDAALQIVMSLADFLIDNIPKIISAAVQLVAGLVHGLAESIPLLIPAAIAMVSALMQDLIDNLDLLIDAAIELVSALATGLVQNLPLLLSAAWDILTGIVYAFITHAPEMWEAGKSLISGLWDGIKSAAGWLWDHISSWARDLLRGVKNIFGIHSPSTVFAGFGEMMMEGLGEGIEDNAGIVSDAMDGISSLITGEMISSVDLNANAAVRSGIISGEYDLADYSSQENMNQAALLREQNSLLRELIEKSGVYLDGKKLAASTNRYARAMGV